MIFLVLIIVVASCSVKTCSDLVSCPTDDSSEESTEGPIVDVGVGVPGRRKGKGRKPTRMMYYTRKGSRGRVPEGSGGYEGSGGRAPEGSGGSGDDSSEESI